MPFPSAHHQLAGTLYLVPLTSMRLQSQIEEHVTQLCFDKDPTRLDAVETHLGCDKQVLSLWLLGMIAMAVIGWAIKRSSSLQEYHRTPMVSIVLGLMLACGWGGWYSLAGLGGHPFTWLACWETWTLLHLLAACYPTTLASILRCNSRARRSQPSIGRSITGRSRQTDNDRPGVTAVSHSQALQHQHDAYPASSAQPPSSALMQHATVDDGKVLTNGRGHSQQSAMRADPGSKPHLVAGQSITNDARFWTQLWWVWQHCKMPLYCIIMGLLLPALTGWLPFKVSSLLPSVMPSTNSGMSAGIDEREFEWAMPLEPNW